MQWVKVTLNFRGRPRTAVLSVVNTSTLKSPVTVCLCHRNPTVRGYPIPRFIMQGISIPFDTETHISSGGFDLITGGGKTIKTPYSDSQQDKSETFFSGSVPDSKFKRKRASIVVTGNYESTEDSVDGKTNWYSEIEAIITPVRDLKDSAAYEQGK